MILPFSMPMITSFPTVAAAVGICQTNLPYSEKWLASHYIQLTAFDKSLPQNEFSHIVNFLDDMGREDLPFHDFSIMHTYKLPRELILSNFSSPTQFLTKAIDAGYYVRGNVNMQYLSCSTEYGKREFYHTAIFYGYDDTDVYVGDFFRNAFSLEKASRAELDAAFAPQTPAYSDSSLFDFTRDITLYKLRTSDYSFYLSDITDALSDYLYARDSTHKFRTSSSHREESAVYGVDCYDMVQKNAVDNQLYDIRPFHVLYDHKLMMKFRLDFLCTHQYLRPGSAEPLQTQLYELTDKALILRNYALKVFLTGQLDRPEHQEKFTSLLRELKNLDIRFTENLLSSLIVSK